MIIPDHIMVRRLRATTAQPQAALGLSLHRPQASGSRVAWSQETMHGQGRQSRTGAIRKAQTGCSWEAEDHVGAAVSSDRSQAGCSVNEQVQAGLCNLTTLQGCLTHCLASAALTTSQHSGKPVHTVRELVWEGTWL